MRRRKFGPDAGDEGDWIGSVHGSTRRMFALLDTHDKSTTPTERAAFLIDESRVAGDSEQPERMDRSSLGSIRREPSGARRDT